MATQFNIAEAKAKLSELLDRALAGADIVIARGGKPPARLEPVLDKPRRKRGAWKDWKLPDDDVLLAPMDPEDIVTW